MSVSKIKVVWLAPFPVTRLQPDICIVRQPTLEHPTSWIVHLADALAARDDVELHIVLASAAVRRSQSVRIKGTTFHVVRHAFPFTCRGFPSYLRLDLWTRFAFLCHQLRLLIRELKPDLLHVHGTESGYGSAARTAGLPTIVSLQGIITLIATETSSTYSGRLQAAIERQVILDSKYFGSRTSWATDFILGLNPDARVYNLSEAIADVFFTTPGGSGSSKILVVGSVLKRKGIEDALEAMRVVVTELPATRLLVVGDGPSGYISYLHRRAASIGIDANVDWLGPKTADEIADLHAASAVLIHPSHIDNSPNSVAEAMASGLPVIASNVGGIPSMIEHHETGILVQPRDPVALAAAIISLLQSDSERRRLANNAKQVAHARNLPAHVAAQTVAIYHDMLARECGRQTSDLASEWPSEPCRPATLLRRLRRMWIAQMRSWSFGAPRRRQPLTPANL